MKKNPNIPTVEDDMLDDNGSSFRDQERPSASARIHEDTIDPDAGIQKGMPARNLKSIMMVVLLVGVLAFLLFPRQKKVELPEVDQKTSHGSIADDLVKDLKNRPAPIAPVTLDSTRLTPLAKTEEPPVDERIQAALVAPMAATDVTFNVAAAVKFRKSSATEQIQSLAEQQKKDSDAQLAALQQQIGARTSSGGTSIGGSSRVGLPGERQSGLSHEEFLDKQNANGVGSSTRLVAARSPNTLYEGTIIRAVLTRAVKTDLPGTLTAKVTSDLYDTVTQRTVLVPRGSEITCRYQSELLVGQKLVLAACTRLRLPNGKSFSLSAATASDLQGASGLAADIDNHFLEMFRDALIVGAASYLLPSDERSITVSTNDSASNVGGAIAGSALKQIIDATIGRNIRIPPTGTVDIGTPFTLTLTKDVDLEPYFQR